MARHEESATLLYLRHVLDETNLSPSALAKAVGISSTTLTRPLNNSQYKFNLSATTLEKIASYSGISFAPFFNNSDLASQTLALLKPGTYDPSLWVGGDEEAEPHQSTIVIGRAGFGAWYEARIHIVEFFPSLLITSTHEKSDQCFAVYVSDRHVEPLASFGTYLFAVRWEVYKNANLDSMLVILERKSEDGRLIELTGRILRKSKSGWTLHCANRAREFQAPVELDELPGSDRERVIGVVQYVIGVPITR